MARILVVDDEEPVRELMTLVLQLEEHDVTQAADGNGCLAALARDTFDLVLTDLVMPDKEGIETIMEIRKMYPDQKIVAMSGGGRGSAGDYLDLAAHLGASRTLEKPFSNEQLLDAVLEVLAG